MALTAVDDKLRGDKAFTRKGDNVSQRTKRGESRKTYLGEKTKAPGGSAETLGGFVKDLKCTPT